MPEVLHIGNQHLKSILMVCDRGTTEEPVTQSRKFFTYDYVDTTPVAAAANKFSCRIVCFIDCL